VARDICRLCYCKITVNRSSHLRRSHGIDTFKGMVKEYFLRPEELGIPIEEFERLPEGASVENLAGS